MPAYFAGEEVGAGGTAAGTFAGGAGRSEGGR